MKESIQNRAVKHGQYFINHDTTIRETAKAMKSSKGTVHTDLIKRLPDIHPALYEKVRERLEQNKAIRHMRGGLKTKKKWEERRKQEEQAADRKEAPAEK